MLARLVTAVAIALSLMTMDASACRTFSSNTSIIYYDVPSGLPNDVIILDVVFEQTIQAQAYNQIRLDRAQVRRVVQGTFEEETVLVLMFMTSCTFDVRPGDQGLVIGRLQTLDDGQSVFNPIQESMFAREARAGRMSPTDR